MVSGSELRLVSGSGAAGGFRFWGCSGGLYVLPSQSVCTERQDRVVTRQVRHPALEVPSQFPQARSHSH